MPSTKDYLDYVLSLMDEELNVTHKKMMGEYMLYNDGILFGGIYDNRFLVKYTPSVSSYNMQDEIPYPSAKPMKLVDFEEKEKIKKLIFSICSDLSKNNKK